MSAPTTPDMTTRPPLVADALLLGRGLAVLRVFIGLIALSNGLAKVFGWHNVRVGPYAGNLLNRDDARGILDFEVFRNKAGGGEGTRLPLVRPVSRFMLEHWDLVGWSLTVLEVGTGLLLVAGLVTRGAAVAALSMHLFLAAVYFSNDRWMFEQPHEYVPLFILAVVPAGRVWGLDAWAAVRTGRTGTGLRTGWPF